MDSEFSHLFAPEDGYVFIVTYGRSGSTLLQNLLNSLDGYCIRGENNHTLFHLSQAFAAVEGAESMKGMRMKGRPSEPSHPWYGAERVDPDRYGRALADAFVAEVLRLEPGTRVGGFKEIRYHTQKQAFAQQLNFIHRVFPKAKFIFNTRDHAAVAKSGWWANQDPEHVAKVLTGAETLYDDYLSVHRERGIRVHYDDYANDPEAFRPLFDFLDEPWDGDLVARVMEKRLEHLKPKRG
jgi:hypothetical protein